MLNECDDFSGSAVKASERDLGRLAVQAELRFRGNAKKMANVRIPNFGVVLIHNSYRSMR